MSSIPESAPSIVIPDHYLLCNLGSSNKECVLSYPYGKEINLSQNIDSVREDTLGNVKNRH